MGDHIMGVFERVAHGPGCAPESALRCLASGPALELVLHMIQSRLGRLSSYNRNYRSWGAWLGGGSRVADGERWITFQHLTSR
jgi:hypothetical protein